VEKALIRLRLWLRRDKRLALLFALACGMVLNACAARGLHSRAAGPGPKPQAVPTPVATPTPPLAQTRPLDESQPVRVRSAHLRYDQRQQRTVFYGGVTVTHDTSTLLARELASGDQGASAEADGGVLLKDTQRHFSAEAGRVRYGNALEEGQLDGGVRLVTLDPHGAAVTITGQEGGYLGLSRSAWAGGGVQVQRGGLTVSARRAELEDDGAVVDLKDDVDVRLGPNRALADEAILRREGQSLELSGSVRARFTPRELREAAEDPWQAGKGEQQ
jgi:lipopolysaccharide export system protein LptA